ncbi:MAG: trigger factor [Firmicutes bacterium]|nr:trigger factor [Bacillota bacterium]
MAYKWEKTEANVGVLEIEVGEDRVASALDQAFRKVVTKINVPGFRKGKVPRRIFEARFGVESLYQDALDILLPEAYSGAVIEAELDPVDRPNIDIVQMEVGKPLVFKATVTVKPEVQLGEYKGVTYEDKSFEVSDADLEEELDRIRKSHAELHVLEEGTAEIGDLLVIDFVGSVDGEVFEGGEAENYQIELGSGTFVGGFEDQLVGVAAGEDREVVITFPETYHVKSLANQEAHFQVHVHDIKRKRLPEMDDEFAKDISEFETFEAYRQNVLEGLKHRAVHEHEHYVQEAVLNQVVDNATIDLPPVMVESEIDGEVKQFEDRLSQQGIPLDAYQEFTGTTTAELRDQFRADAERRVRTSLVLEAVAAAEGLAVTDEEVDLELQKVADSARLDFDRVKALMSARDPGFTGLRDEILSRKTVDFLVSNGVKA